MIKRLAKSPEEGVRRNEPMQLRVVVPAAQPVHPRLVVVDIAPVADRVRVAQGVGQLARAALLSAPCVVLVFYHNRAVRVKELWHEKSPAGEGGAKGEILEMHTISTVSGTVDICSSFKASVDAKCVQFTDQALTFGVYFITPPIIKENQNIAVTIGVFFIFINTPYR